MKKDCKGNDRSCYFFFTAVESVGPTDSYYEKVSEELEKIVHEVKETEAALTDGKYQCAYVY